METNIAKEVGRGNMTEQDLQLRLRNNLRKYRKERGLTQETLAEKAGVSLASYKSYESGANGISLEALAKLGNALDIDPASLLLLDDVDQSMSNIYRLLQNKPESFVMAVEETVRAFSKAFDSKKL